MTVSRRTLGLSLLSLAAAVPFAGTLAACSESSEAVPGAPSSGPRSGGTLTWGVETEATTLNPQLNGQDKTKLYLRNAYESLLARKDDGTFVGWLATKWEVSQDQLTYTFTLRDGVKFHDGEALSAATVVTNVTQLQDATYNSSSAAGPLSHVASVKASDDTTVVLVLKDRYAPFLDYIGSLALLSTKSFASSDLKSGGPGVAGTGPFVLASYAKGQQLEFTRFEEYNWAPETRGHQGAAHLEKVIYRFLPESSVRLGALQSQQLQVIEGVPGTLAAQFKDNPQYSYQTSLNTGTPYSLYFNSTVEPTSEQKVREAFRHAVDLDAILTSVYAGQRTRAWSAVSPQDPNFYDKSLEGTYGNDPAKANALLDEAGWTGRDGDGFRTKDGKRLTIVNYQSKPYVRDQRDVLLQAIQAQVKQNAGIDFDVQVVDSGIADQHRAARDYGTWDNSNTNPDGVDIEYHWLLPDHGGFINLSVATDPELVDWLRKAQQTTDVAERAQHYFALQQFVIAEKAYSLPLYEPEDQIAALASVQGVGFRTYHQLPENAYDIWLEE